MQASLCKAGLNWKRLPFLIQTRPGLSRDRAECIWKERKSRLLAHARFLTFPPTWMMSFSSLSVFCFVCFFLLFFEGKIRGNMVQRCLVHGLFVCLRHVKPDGPSSPNTRLWMDWMVISATESFSPHKMYANKRCLTFLYRSILFFSLKFKGLHSRRPRSKANWWALCTLLCH